MLLDLNLTELWIRIPARTAALQGSIRELCEGNDLLLFVITKIFITRTYPSE